MRSCIDTLTGGKAGQIYAELVQSERYTSPHAFVKSAYENYTKNYPDNKSINGRIFEYLICETLAQHKIAPFYYQAKFDLVPNADFDVVLYHPQRPVVLTMKNILA